MNLVTTDVWNSEHQSWTDCVNNSITVDGSQVNCTNGVPPIVDDARLPASECMSAYFAVFMVRDGKVFKVYKRLARQCSEFS